MDAFMESVERRRKERKKMFKAIKNTSYDFHRPIAKEIIHKNERLLTKGNRVGKTSVRMGRKLTREEHKTTRKKDLILGR